MNEFIKIMSIHSSFKELEGDIIKKLEELNWDLIVGYDQYDETEIYIPIKKLKELLIK